ncbi:unnamed protein product [Owenia fusiformis]|uniref:Uncharacterized protein n=1 Tax=Owenia fusiformis TaxID=6347 RepID=A0A8S4P2U8_OWEFU|nr:unnamed protein product [Owenia fusiformis]
MMKMIIIRVFILTQLLILESRAQKGNGKGNGKGLVDGLPTPVVYTFDLDTEGFTSIPPDASLRNCDNIDNCNFQITSPSPTEPTELYSPIITHRSSDYTFKLSFKVLSAVATAGSLLLFRQDASTNVRTEIWRNPAVFLPQRITYEGLPNGEYRLVFVVTGATVQIDHIELYGSHWAPWDGGETCSTTCEEGVKTFTRVCLHPEDRLPRDSCIGETVKYEYCNKGPCPIDGFWGDWKNPSICSATCGGDGSMSYTRECDSPAPMFGGAACVGPSILNTPCNRFPCSVCDSENGVADFFVDAYSAISSNSLDAIVSFDDTYKGLIETAVKKCTGGNKDFCQIRDVLFNFAKMRDARNKVGVGYRDISDSELKSVGLQSYLSELKQVYLRHQQLYDVYTGMNIEMNQTTREFKYLNAFYRAQIDYNIEIARQDLATINSFFESILATVKSMSEDVEDDFQQLHIRAGVMVAAELVELIATNAATIAGCVASSVILAPCSGSDIWELAALLSTVTKNSAIAVMWIQVEERMRTNVDSILADIELAKNEINALEDSLNFIEDDLKFAEGDEIEIINRKLLDFVNQYGGTPSVGISGSKAASIFTEYSNHMGRVCEYYYETEAIASGVIALGLTNFFVLKCPKMLASLAELEGKIGTLSGYIDDKGGVISRILGLHIAKEHVKFIGSTETQINLHEIINVLVLDEARLQSIAIQICSTIEFRNGGRRPSVCKHDYFTRDAIDQIMSLVVSEEADIEYSVYVPTYNPSVPNVDKKYTIDMNALLMGDTVSFKLPNDPIWLLENQWIDCADEFEKANYIESMAMLLPDLQCNDEQYVVCMTITTGLFSKLYPTVVSPKFKSCPNKFAFSYQGNFKWCPIGNSISTPFGPAETICVRSSPDIATKEVGNEKIVLHASYYSEFYVTMKYDISDTCRDELRERVKDIAKVPFVIKRYVKSENVDNCWPQPCRNGGTCTNSQEPNKMTCDCPTGATGLECEKVGSVVTELWKPIGECSVTCGAGEREYEEVCYDEEGKVMICARPLTKFEECNAQPCPIPCPTLADPEDGSTVSTCNIWPNCEQFFECDDGYEIIGGSRSRTCQYNGEWTGTETVCQTDIGGVAAQKVCSPFECPDGWSLVPDSTETTTRCVSGEQVTCIEN